MPLLAVAALLALTRPAAAQIDPSIFSSTMAGRIGRIRVEAANVFDPARPGEDWGLFRLANRLHRVTRPPVVERELLFSPGEPFDPALLAETERNLRRLGFLRSAMVEPVPGPNGQIDVHVRTSDAWSLSPDASWKRQGGRNTWRVGMSELNLAGHGKSLSAAGQQTALGFERSLTWSDPQVWGRRLRFDAEARNRSDLTRYKVALARPFFASISTYTLGTTALYQDQVVPLYVDGAPQGKVRQVGSDVGIEYGRSLGSTPRRVRQATVGLHRSASEYRAVPETVTALPESVERNTVELAGRWEKVRFVKVRNIREMIRDEDYNMGPSFVPRLAFGPRFLGGPYGSIAPSLSVGAGQAFGPDRFVVARALYSGAVNEAHLPNSTVGFDVQYYDQPIRRHTFATRLAFDRLVHPGPGGVLLLGEETGLRGYGLQQFQGDRRVIANFEDRILLADELFHLVSFGVAGFVDAGYAWSGNDRMDIADLRPSAGVGLRLGSSRSTHNEPLRVDFAYAFRNNQQRSQWSVSILRGQLFGPAQ